jgi:hypothetical protein
MSTNRRRRAAVAAAVCLTVVEAATLARRRGFLIGAETIVRCRAGHLFTTLWIPGGSLKAIRLGPWRLQRCPVGRHWSFVTPARQAELNQRERRIAAKHHDLRIP